MPLLAAGPKTGGPLGELAGPSSTWVPLEQPPAALERRSVRVKKPSAALMAAAADYDSEMEVEEQGAQQAVEAEAQQVATEAAAATVAEAAEEEEDDDEMLVAVPPPGARSSPYKSPLRHAGQPSEAQIARQHVLEHNEMIRDALKVRCRGDGTQGSAGAGSG